MDFGEPCRRSGAQTGLDLLDPAVRNMTLVHVKLTTVQWLVWSCMLTKTYQNGVYNKI